MADETPRRAAPARKTAPRRPPVKKAAASSGVKKAAAAEAAGGGPEDPIADIAAAAALKGGGKKSGGGTGGAPAAGTTKLAKNNPLLLGEFITCFVILGLGTLVTPKSSEEGSNIPRLMIKSSALAGLFLILALVSSTGGKARKTASALGGLVTVTYIVASTDAIAIFNWASKYFGAGQKSSTIPGELEVNSQGEAQVVNPVPQYGAPQ